MKIKTNIKAGGWEEDVFKELQAIYDAGRSEEMDGPQAGGSIRA